MKIKRIDKTLPLPKYAHHGDAGLDLLASVGTSLVISPGERLLIKTGVAVEIPLGFEGQVRARSGLALKHGLGLANGIGTIDHAYVNEIGVILVNNGTNYFTINHGDRIAQLVISPIEIVELEEVEELEEVGRGMAGFGSSGVAGV